MPPEVFLADALDLSSGKSIAAGGDGLYPVYGSAGIIGSAESPLYQRGIIIGRVGAYCGAVEMSERPFWASDNTIVATPKESYDLRFMYYLLAHLDLRRYAGGAAQPLMTQTVIKGLRARIAPLPTQRKIAAILSAYDDLIENNARRIGILEEMARLLYREWFVDFRFPGHESVAMVDSPLGPLPEGWALSKLGTVADTNAVTLRPASAPDAIHYVDIKSVSPGRIDKVEPMLFREAPGRARRVVAHGDTIWSSVRPNRRSYCLILLPAENLIVSTGFTVIAARHVPYSYLYCAVTTDEFVGYIVGRTTGAAYPAVTAADFESATVLLPPPEILDSFHDTVADMLSLCDGLHRQNSNLRQTRDLLLPRLISGEIDVTDLDINTEGLAA